MFTFHRGIVPIYMAMAHEQTAHWQSWENHLNTHPGQELCTPTPQPWLEPVLWGSHSRNPSYSKPCHSRLVTLFIWQPLMMLHAKPSLCFFLIGLDFLKTTPFAATLLRMAVLRSARCETCWYCLRGASSISISSWAWQEFCSTISCTSASSSLSL